VPIVVQDASPAPSDIAVVVPVLALPLRLVGRSLATLPQGGTDELQQSVRLALTTRPGERLASTDYGTPDLAFDTDIDPGVVAGAIADWEPRVTVEVTVDRSNPADPLVLAVISPGSTDDPDLED
jgi:phage baseplate assembly protein W